MTPIQTEGARSVQRLDEKPVTHKITDVVAEELGIDPIDLPPLYHTIDPDALERLIASSDTDDMHVAFNYAGCQVVITGGTIITAEDRAEIE